MDILQAMKERHSVRRYTDKPIEPEKIQEIEKAIASIESPKRLINCARIIFMYCFCLNISLYPIFFSFVGSKVRLQIDATNEYIPQVM